MFVEAINDEFESTQQEPQPQNTSGLESVLDYNNFNIQPTVSEGPTTSIDDTLFFTVEPTTSNDTIIDQPNQSYLEVNVIHS